MPSELGLNFNRVPTFANFQALAQQSPAEAKNALQRVAVGLQKTSAPPDQLAQLDAILKANEAQIAALTESSALLKSIFPDANGTAPTNFAECIAKMTNVQSLNWTAGEAAPPVSITGTIAKNTAGQFVLTTSGGREMTLHDSERASKISPGLPMGWIEGFVNNGEGQMTVQGTVSSDGKTMAVEGYAPGTNPDFVFGRIAVSSPMGPITTKLTPDQLAEVMTSGRVVIGTARGEVEVTDPTLKKMLAQVPRLGVILPGATSKDANGKTVFASNSDFMYALGGRFAGLNDKGGGLYETDAQFAYSVFHGPVRCEGETAKFRMEHSANQRNWVGGTFVLDGADPHFAAKYISNDLGGSTLTAPNTGEGSLAAQFLASAEVVDIPEDFVRKMGPPPPAA